MTIQTVIKNPTWWRRRTMMERYCTMLAAAAILLCAALALSILYIRQKERSEVNDRMTAALDRNDDTLFPSAGQKPTNCDEDICLTPGCVYTASNLLEKMNPNIDPCDDFYEFVCGNFINETVIPDDKSSVSLFSTIGDTLTDQLRTIIEEPSGDKEARPFRMAKDFYKSCMNQSKIEYVGLTHMKEIIKRMGGWPVLDGDSWDPSDFIWLNMTYRFKEEGFSIDYLISFSVSPDKKNNTKRIVELDQPSLSLSREYLVKGMDEKLVAALYSYMVDIATMFGADRERAKTELKESLEFEMKLANISLPPEERRDDNKLYNPMTIPKMQEKFPSIPWYEYFTTILPEAVNVHSDELIIVDVPSYIKGLEALLITTPKRVQANYLVWRAVASAVPYLTEALRNRELVYGTSISGQTERAPRWKECVDELSDESLALAVGSLYVRSFFKEEAKKSALEIVNNIRDEMYKTLEEVKWMDDTTRKNALEKAKSIISHVGYPKELLEDDAMEEFYNKLELTDGDYLQAVLNLTKFDMDFSLNRLRKPVNKTEWITYGQVAIVNAFYSPEDNSIQIPAGILQGAFFSYNQPNYMNYGGIGFVVGHEITHGFDDQATTGDREVKLGSRYDKDGNLVDWWETKTKEAYLKKAQCIIQQYGNYTAEQVGLKLNGVNTQGENIADNGGIKQAYKAYNRWVKRYGTEKRLPGLQDFTPQQMFWMSAANVWCTKYRPEVLKLKIVTDPHSPAQFRVLGPLSNRPEFARDFNCPSGSTMNPVQKCQVW